MAKGYIGVMRSHIGLYKGYVGIMERKRKLLFRVWG